ncbi:MAG TPA: SPFH domain-containing protein [Clostridiales bacterium]|nr:SPFH domain-containing protein [Clostridiales bacterium]
MAFFKSQLLKVIEWADNTHDTMAYKYPIPPKTQIMMGSQLIVRESQVAILVSSGKIADVFEPGRYKLNTGNMPILTKLRSWKYGFNSPFVCDVYFINTKQFINQKWGTGSPVMMRDQDFGVVQFRGYGIFSFKVSEPAVFLREVLGTSALYKVDALMEQLKRSIVSAISEAVAASNIPALDLAMKYTAIGDKAEEIVKADFNKTGISLVNLVVENLSLTEESAKALNERTRMNILGNPQEYTQYAAADSMKTIAENAHKGGGMNMAGTAMQMGAGWAIGSTFGSAISGSGEKGAPPMAAAMTAPTVACSQCGATISAKSKFCSECGAKTPFVAAGKFCSACGKQNKPKARFCAECGTKL